MYPNEQVIEVFGEQVKWPGFGPDGKFTNGSFTDPAIKPSFIPAETLNLLLDNMQRVIEEAGLEPNNIEQDQLARATKAFSKKTATLVVGTALSGHTLADCDYLCDGTDDQVEINAAILALPAVGGKVVIREGTYSIAASIIINANNLIIEGMGASTVLKRMYNSVTSEGIVSVSRDYCAVRNLQIDGNKANYTNNSNCGIIVHNDNCTVSGNACHNNANRGIYVTGGNCTVSWNTCNGNGDNGITANSNCTVSGNACNGNSICGIIVHNDNCTVSGNACNGNGANGISAGGNCAISGNACIGNGANGITVHNDNCTVSGNACNGNGVSGIVVDSGNANSITGCAVSANTCIGNGVSGINLENCSNNTVSANTCLRGAGQPSDYTSAQYTIRAGGVTANNLVISNNIMGKNYVNLGNASNTFANNKYN